MGGHFWAGRSRRAGFEQTRGSHALDVKHQAQLKAAVQEVPEQVGIDLSNWNWKAVHRFVQKRLGLALSRSSCLNYLHRLDLC